MKRHTIQNTMITRLAALALSALFILQVHVRAQGMIGYIVIFPSVGLAPDQNLRLTLSNMGGASVQAQARVHHAGGIHVALVDGSVRAGAFHSFDFKHSDIPLPGEPGTGRIQLQASVRLVFSKEIGPVAFSMETIDVTDGTSVTLIFDEIGRDVEVRSAGNAHLIGIAPGQRMRVTVSYIPSRIVLAENGSYNQGKPISAHVEVFDGNGNPIAQRAEQVIPAGEFRSFDFDRFDLATAGEPGTNRAQARFVVVDSATNSARRSPDIPTDVISFEVIDIRTGKTTVLSGHQCLVFFAAGAGR